MQVDEGVSDELGHALDGRSMRPVRVVNRSKGYLAPLDTSVTIRHEVDPKHLLGIGWRSGACG